MSIARKCTVDECDSIRYNQSSMCKQHYSDYGRNYRIEKGCSTDGCAGRLYAKKMCSKHWLREKKGMKPYGGGWDKRPAVIEGDIAKIPLGANAKDGYAVVDRYFSHLDRHNWHMNDSGYAITSINKKHVRMHHLIIGRPPKGMVADHINRVRLDNRKDNLRFVTRQQNSANSSPTRATSIYKGVYYSHTRDSGEDMYAARISDNGISRQLGVFSSQKQAARAYDKAAKLAFGEYAYLNDV